MIREMISSDTPSIERCTAEAATRLDFWDGDFPEFSRPVEKASIVYQTQVLFQVILSVERSFLAR